MADGLVDLRIERVTDLAVLLQAQTRDRRLERLGDRLEGTVEVAVVAGATDVVENGQQISERRTDGELLDGFPIALDALAIVGVFGVHTLQVGGELDDPSVENRGVGVDVEALDEELVHDLLAGARGGGRVSGLAAVAGYPNLTVPMGQIHGLPVGFAFIGPVWSEARLLALGAAFEAVVQGRKPPTYAASVESMPEVAKALAPPLASPQPR